LDLRVSIQETACVSLGAFTVSELDVVFSGYQPR